MYIGSSPTIGNFQVCDAISVVNGQASYTMQVSGVNATPQSANHMLVSLNGILQAPNSSFTVSGSTITFASNLVTGDVIDFIQILGDVLDLGVPSDNTVSLAKLTASGTKDATTFLRGDNSFSTLPASGITMADQWRFSTNFLSSSEKINTGWERNDNSYYGGIGTGMTESSGNFTFPSTGIYYISFVSSFNASAFRSYAGLKLRGSSDGGSNYSDLIDVYDSISSSGEYGNVNGNYLLDVTNVSNIKVALYTSASGAVTYEGHSSLNRSYMTFIRLGDT